MLFEEDRRQVSADSPRIGIDRAAKHHYADIVGRVTSNSRLKKINAAGSSIQYSFELHRNHPTKTIAIDIRCKHRIYRILREQCSTAQRAIPLVKIVDCGV